MEITIFLRQGTQSLCASLLLVFLCGEREVCLCLKRMATQKKMSISTVQTKFQSQQLCRNSSAMCLFLHKNLSYYPLCFRILHIDAFLVDSLGLAAERMRMSFVFMPAPFHFLYRSRPCICRKT
ncbi:hypothetical protein BX666DRAFT_1426903 [Dichotomocladium elegans]|nr:hypothetical protein BX666DRAFT_1426903 [Dichotomocladium elegans]